MDDMLSTASSGGRMMAKDEQTAKSSVTKEEQKAKKENCVPDPAKPRRFGRAVRASVNKMGADELRDHWEHMQAEMKLLIQRIEKEYDLKLQKSEEEINSLCERLTTEEHRCRYLAQTIIDVLPIIEYAAQQRPLPFEVKQTAMSIWRYLGTEAECGQSRNREEEEEEEVVPTPGSSPITGLLHIPACLCRSPKGLKKEHNKTAIDAEVASYIWSVKASLRASVNRSAVLNGLADWQSDGNKPIGMGPASRSATGHCCAAGTRTTEAVEEVAATCSLEGEGEGNDFRGLQMGGAEDPEQVKTPTFGRSSFSFFADYRPLGNCEKEGDEVCTKCREILDRDCGAIDNWKCVERLSRGHDATMLRQSSNINTDCFVYDKECGSGFRMSLGRCEPDERADPLREIDSSVRWPCRFQHALPDTSARGEGGDLSCTDSGRNTWPAPEQRTGPEEDPDKPSTTSSRGKFMDTYVHVQGPGSTSAEPDTQQRRMEMELPRGSSSPSSLSLSLSHRFSNPESSRLTSGSSVAARSRPCNSSTPPSSSLPGLEALLSERWSHSRADVEGTVDKPSEHENHDARCGGAWGDAEKSCGKEKAGHQMTECSSDTVFRTSSTLGVNGLSSPTRRTSNNDGSCHHDSLASKAGDNSGEAKNRIPGRMPSCAEPELSARRERGEVQEMMLAHTEQAGEQVRCRIPGRWSDHRVCVRQWYRPASRAWGLDCRGILGEGPAEGLLSGSRLQSEQRVQPVSHACRDDNVRRTDTGTASAPPASGSSKPWLVGKLIGSLVSAIPPLWETRGPAPASEKQNRNEDAGAASILKSLGDDDVHRRVVGVGMQNGSRLTDDRRPSSSDVFPLRGSERRAAYRSSWDTEKSRGEGRCGSSKKHPRMLGYGPGQWWIACSLWCFSCLGFIVMSLLHDCRIRILLV